ncbi:MAG: formylglycine-generating enzyme family protein [Nitrospina sp.]|nr:formylglycine-generating enzyme family protein [Nitrospina sp.]
MNNLRHRYFIYFFSLLSFLLICNNLYALSSVNNRIDFQDSDFSMGNVYCSEEQKNSDWCADEIPHKVRLKSFSLDKYEVTNSEYLKCFTEGVCSPNDLHETRPKDFDGAKQPVVFVSWKDAQVFCKWRGGNLPTEAQWELAAQGDNPGGAHFKQIYNVGATVDVGSLRPNSNGLYDMLGNVYEWTLDWYGPYKLETHLSNPKGPPSGEEKVVRGGAWHSPSHFLRSSDRVAKVPEYKYSDVGMRCAYSIK